MLVDEIGLVPVEPICDEDGDIILPGIPRGSLEQDPFVHLRDFQECFCPSPVADDTLLVKYKETIFYIFVLADVVPRVDDDLVLVVIAVLMGGEQEWSQLVLPFTGIALACSGDDVNIKRIFHRRIRDVKISALLKIVIGESSSGFTGTDPAA